MSSLADNATSVVPNPNTPFAFLPPEASTQYLVEGYVTAIVLGIWFWDVFIGIIEEARIYKNTKFGFPDVLYYLSRITSGGFYVSYFLFAVAPFDDCRRITQITGWFGAFATPLTSSLFLHRIWGVFHTSRIIRLFFVLLWMSTFVSLESAFTFHTKHIGPTKYCIISSVSKTSSLVYILVTIYDTMVFLAISSKMLLDSPGQGWKAHVISFCTGHNMGYISRALLQTGQIYYSITCSANLVALILLIHPRIPSVVKSVVTIPVLVLQNAMACRVFRLLKLRCLKPSSDPFRALVSSTPEDPTQTVRFTHDAPDFPHSTMGTSSELGTTGSVKPSDSAV